jgi:hypothetical protein
MSLVVVQWGGRISSSRSTITPSGEIWSCSMSLLAGTSPVPSTISSVVAPAIAAYHSRALTHIDSTVLLDYVKVNEVDVETGLQITDPTNEDLYVTPSRGGATAGDYPPMTQACRVTIDNNTRSRTTRGGWFIPRPQLAIGGNGRADSSFVANIAASTATLIDAINAISGVSVGVWSRKNASVTAVTRLRVGDVPDNISTRKNGLPEAYNVTSITP